MTKPKPSKLLKDTLRKLKGNRVFRAALRALKLLTLVLFGICIVSFVSAVTQIFTIGDAYIELMMRWALILLLGSIVLLFTVVLLSIIYDFIRTVMQRRQQTKLDR